jgi:hypothetical protein
MYNPDKKNIRRLIRESVRREILWESFRQNTLKKILKMESLGYSKNQINENFVKMLKGLITSIMGTGASGATGGEGGIGSFKTIMKEKALQYMLNQVGIDPDSAAGSIIRNGIQEAFATLTDAEFKLLLAGGDKCRPVSMKMGHIIGVALKDGLKEKLFTEIVNGIFEDMSGGKDNLLFGGIFIDMRERFSKALEEPLDSALSSVFDSDDMNQKIAEKICDINLVDIVKGINPNVKDSVSDYLSGAGSSLKSLMNL